MSIEQVVHTRYGAVRGFQDEGDTICWKAIPFARPPVGELRWKAPRDPEPWPGIRERKEFAEPCLQTHFLRGELLGSEDCLYLNIWRPRTGERDLPVYFWIHGGGNFAQLPLHQECSGARVAARSNVLFVSINYRLAELGWLSHPALRSGRPGDELDDSGNYGTLDIIKALGWVRDNIEAFGGNPGKVLITGESAGGYNVLTLLVSPAARGLFHRAMVQSGRAGTIPRADADAEAEAMILRLLVGDGTSSDPAAAAGQLRGMTPAALAAYLRSKSYRELSACRQRRSLVFESIEDGTVLPAGGLRILAEGGHPNLVPVIIGMNKEEAKLFGFLSNAFQDDDELYETASDLASDRKKASSCDALLRALRSRPDQPEVYGYQFCWGAGGRGKSPIPPPFEVRLGAYHGLDISFFFDLDTNLGPLGDLVFTGPNRPGRKALTERMMAYLASFARTGNPNPSGPVPGWVEWEPWSNHPEGPKCITFDVEGDIPRIEMSRQEVTERKVEARLAGLPEPAGSAVRRHLEAVSAFGW